MKEGNKITEMSSRYDHLESMSIHQLLSGINTEDKKVPEVVGEQISKIESLLHGIIKRMNNGGRLFYLGAGTSGRLGILDASEVPPTFGAPYDLVIGLIAGGDMAIRKAVESAEDDWEQAWKDMISYKPTAKDVVIGIAASGTTPYVIGGVIKARAEGMLTGCITCNPDSELAKNVEHPIELVVGPEFVTGSTRMKAGTATKLVLNMITTSAMIKMGRVKGNKMVDMQLTNQKLINRGVKMIMDETGLNPDEAKRLLLLHGSVREVLDKINNR